MCYFVDQAGRSASSSDATIGGILSLAESTGYKYLDVLEGNVFDVSQIKLLVQQQFFQQSRTILKT